MSQPNGGKHFRADGKGAADVRLVRHHEHEENGKQKKDNRPAHSVNKQSLAERQIHGEHVEKHVHRSLPVTFLTHLQHLPRL